MEGIAGEGMGCFTKHLSQATLDKVTQRTLEATPTIQSWLWKKGFALGQTNKQRMLIK